MASDSKTMTVVPLNGSNYSTWKVMGRSQWHGSGPKCSRGRGQARQVLEKG